MVMHLKLKGVTMAEYMIEAKKLVAEYPDVLRYIKGNGLDLGSGLGKVKQSALGIDFGENGINWVGNVTQLHWFHDNVLDYVFSSHCLEHMHNEVEVVKEWKRVVKPGGYVVIYLPDDNYFDNGPQLKQGEHKRVYDTPAMEKLLRDVGLTVVECFSHHGQVKQYHGQHVYSVLGVGRK